MEKKPRSNGDASRVTNGEPKKKVRVPATPLCPSPVRQPTDILLPTALSVSHIFCWTLGCWRYWCHEEQGRPNSPGQTPRVGRGRVGSRALKGRNRVLGHRRTPTRSVLAVLVYHALSGLHTTR